MFCRLQFEFYNFECINFFILKLYNLKYFILIEFVCPQCKMCATFIVLNLKFFKFKELKIKIILLFSAFSLYSCTQKNICLEFKGPFI